MRLRSKRLVSLLLAGSMMVSMVPASAVTAFAAEAKNGVVALAGAKQDVPADGVCSVEVTEASDENKSGVQKALEAKYNISNTGDKGFDDIKTLTVTTADGIVLDEDDFQFMSGIVTKNQGRNDVKVAPEGLTYLTNLEEMDLSEARCENDEIPAKAFFKNKKITKIILPQSIKRIGHHAFSAMYNETTGTGLSYLSTDKNVNLRFDGVEILGESMASRDRNLKDPLELPASLIAIGDACFANSGVSGAITIRINIDKNIDCNGEGTAELSQAQFAGTDDSNNGTNIDSLSFQDDATRIPGYIAKNCKSLKKIIISDTVSEIGEQAFFGTGLSEVVIPEKVDTIAKRAFMDSNMLDTVIVDNPNVSIDWLAFYGLKSGAKIYLASPMNNVNDNDNEQYHKRWNADTTTILNTDEGTIAHDNNGDVTAELDTTTGLYVPTKEGYKFLGWYTDVNDENTKLTTAAVAGQTYTAKWAPKAKYTVTVDYAGKGGTNYETNVTYPNTIDEPQHKDVDGYTFGGWYDGDTKVTFPLKVTANTTLTAKWIADHQLTVVGGTFTVKDETVETKTEDDKLIANVPEGAEVTVTFNKDTYADSNLTFGGWKIEGLDDADKYTGEEFTFTMPKTGVTIEALTKTADTEDDSWDAGTVVTGVVLGTGAAVLTYHIGTDLYAEQVLGKGVAVPKTREDVALKAWELAGKPAVELNGEPLSEAVQAEKWAVESGLMQNDAQGSFNGAKKMNKLKALRVLDAAKKLG